MNKLNYKVSNKDGVAFLYVEPEQGDWYMMMSYHSDRLHIVLHDKSDVDNYWEKTVDDDTLEDEEEVKKIHSSLPSWATIDSEEFNKAVLYLILRDVSDIISRHTRKVL